MKIICLYLAVVLISPITVKSLIGPISKLVFTIYVVPQNTWRTLAVPPSVHSRSCPFRCAVLSGLISTEMDLLRVISWGQDFTRYHFNFFFLSPGNLPILSGLSVKFSNFYQLSGIRGFRFTTQIRIHDSGAKARTTI